MDFLCCLQFAGAYLKIKVKLFIYIHLATALLLYEKYIPLESQYHGYCDVIVFACPCAEFRAEPKFRIQLPGNLAALW